MTTDARDALARLNAAVLHAALHTSEPDSILKVIVDWLAEPEQVESMARAFLWPPNQGMPSPDEVPKRIRAAVAALRETRT